jgi:hypothetical protein
MYVVGSDGSRGAGHALAGVQRAAQVSTPMDVFNLRLTSINRITDGSGP